MRRQAKAWAGRAGWWVGLLIAFFLLPLFGAVAAGRPLARFLEFPPQAVERQAPSFNPYAWGVLVFLGALAVVWWFALRTRAAVPDSSPEKVRAGRTGFPVWGWTGLIWIAAAWVLAWTRLEWMEPVQAYTFPPLWLGYVWVANAMLVARRGTCPLLEAPLHYLALFPVSAVFWWVFEYLNRFTRNWEYTPVVDLTATEYVVHATLSFSTLLPAVYATYLLLGTFSRIRRFLAAGPPLPLDEGPLGRGIAAVAGAAGMVALGAWPTVVFPFLWVIPIFLLYAWLPPGRRRSLGDSLRRGDWRWAGSWALAALICGFFWEMWNYYSELKWVYGVPHFHVLKIFEMPLLGYFGYLPFGVVCGLVVDSFRCNRG